MVDIIVPVTTEFTRITILVCIRRYNTVILTNGTVIGPIRSYVIFVLRGFWMSIFPITHQENIASTRQPLAALGIAKCENPVLFAWFVCKSAFTLAIHSLSLSLRWYVRVKIVFEKISSFIWVWEESPESFIPGCSFFTLDFTQLYKHIPYH